MTYTLFCRLIACVVIFTVGAPAFAERLEQSWQGPRDYFNRLSDQACEGDQGAYIELSNSALLKNNAVAMNDLGWVFSTQKCSFSNADLSYAAEQYKRSALGRYPLGQMNYAEYLMEGVSFERNPELAKGYFLRALNAGYGNSGVKLGRYYLSGEFLPIDDVKARSLYDRARDAGADQSKLKRLAIELANVETSSGPEMSQIDERQKLFTDAWGYGYGEARWDHAPNGKFQARVFVGVFDDTKQVYLGLMRDTFDPTVRVTGVYVEKADETQTRIDLGFCTSETCQVEQYGDNFGSPGSFITITLPRSSQRATLEAIKSGKYIAFNYVTQGGNKTYTLGLKGSRKAIETLERQNGVSSSRIGNSGSVNASSADTGAYRSAVKSLIQRLTLEWVHARGGAQAGRQSFVATDTPCVFQTFVDHPNTGKTTREFNLGHFDPERVAWEEHFFFGKPAFFTVRTLGDREVSSIWTNYPDGTSDSKKEADVSFYIGLEGDFSGVKPHMETAIRHCNAVVGQ